MSDIKSHRKSPKGRPAKLTDELLSEIVENIRIGAYVETAAAAAGLSKDTFYRWLKRGRRALDKLEKSGEMAEEDEIYAHFSDAIKKAQADAEMRDVALIARAAQTTWQAAAWRLERKFPDRWGQKVRQEVDHQGVLGVTQIPPEKQEEYQQRLAKFFGESVTLHTEDSEEDADSGDDE